MDDFLRYETINENFFKNSKSTFISQEQKLSKEIRNNLDSLKGLNVFPGINQDIQSSLNLLSNYDSSFYSLVNLLKNRGFKDFGLENFKPKLQYFSHLQNHILLWIVFVT